ncbi:MAG: DUF3520 domain-containing protein [Deltaproteobacteria bacterium]|nr:DUF3520 domain-containing protein [Deltaproteobacteria bacterium]
MGNYNDVLMERLADLGNGNYSFVDNERAARRIVDRELTGWLQVAAKDVKLSLELDPAAVSRYRLIGYENRHLMAPDFANDRVDAGEVGAGQAVTALYELKLAAPTPRQLGVFRIRFEDPDGGSSRLVETSLTTDGLRPTFERASPPMRLAATVAAFAEKLRGSYWARAVRYDDLLDRIETLGPPLSERAEVIELRRAMVLARGLDHRDDRFDADSPAATMGFDEVPILR